MMNHQIYHYKYLLNVHKPSKQVWILIDFGGTKGLNSDYKFVFWHFVQFWLRERYHVVYIFVIKNVLQGSWLMYCLTIKSSEEYSIIQLFEDIENIIFSWKRLYIRSRYDDNYLFLIWEYFITIKNKFQWLNLFSKKYVYKKKSHCQEQFWIIIYKSSWWVHITNLSDSNSSSVPF